LSIEYVEFGSQVGVILKNAHIERKIKKNYQKFTKVEVFTAFGANDALANKSVPEIVWLVR
jgi:hypothetical protein